MDQKYTLAGMILEYLPDFCWQEYMEIVTMIEQVYLNVNPQSMQVSIAILKKEGKIITKESHYPHHTSGRRSVLYRKNPSYNCVTK